MCYVWIAVVGLMSVSVITVSVVVSRKITVAVAGVRILETLQRIWTVRIVQAITTKKVTAITKKREVNCMGYVKVNKQQEEVCKVELSPYIVLPLDVYNELSAYVAHYKTEVSGYGFVTEYTDKDGDPYYRVDEVILPSEQKNTMSTTEIDEEYIHKHITQLLQENKAHLVPKLRFHWHSHCDMSVFHSGTDTDNYDTLKSGEYLLSLVLNKAGDILGRIDYYKPFRLSISGIAVYVEANDSPESEKRILDNIKALDEYIKSKPLSNLYQSMHNGVKEYVYDDYADEWDKPIDRGATVGEIMDENIKKEYYEQKEAVRNIHRLSKADAKRYEQCCRDTTTHCAGCIDREECEEYIYDLDEVVEFYNGGYKI